MAVLEISSSPVKYLKQSTSDKSLGARRFFNSLEAAIFLFSRVAEISPKTHVVPAINNNSRITIGAKLQNGQTIFGQTQISHPSSDVTVVDKDHTSPLPSPIEEIFYLNEYMQMIQPPVNPTVIQKIRETEVIIYSFGSLYTSIIPCLILKEVGEAIAANCGIKILILNGYSDRETQSMSAMDYILAITKALNRNNELQNTSSQYITHLLYADKTTIDVDVPESLRIRCIPVDSFSQDGKVYYNETALCETLKEITSDVKIK